MFKPVTWRPQPESTNIAATTTAVTSRRTLISSATVRSTAVALLCALGLHLAFPLTTWWWIAPFACAGLFYSWSSLAPRTAAIVGYASGLLFFTLGFAWFGETAGALVGPAAPILDLGPALAEAVAFAFTAYVTSLAARSCDARIVPFVSAAAFALAEQVRSSTVLGVPIEQLGVAMVDSPLRPLAAFAGGYGLTFATFLLGAALGWWLVNRHDARRARIALAVWAGGEPFTPLAYAVWPARHYAPPTKRVVAVQGGIAQSIKQSDAGLTLALQRYTAMTLPLRAQHPSLILWPETVITTDLLRAPALRARFAALADDLGTTLYTGSFCDDGTRREDALLIFDPRVNRNDIAALYIKEQLVPFAEHVPGPAWLRSLPYADLIGRFTPGHNARETYDGVTALICWESFFGDIAHERLRENPSLFLIATDDAWFGTTEGPYEHAQAATLRAVETGRWVMRSAATGISGIVEHDGTWTRRTTLNVAAVVVG